MSYYPLPAKRVLRAEKCIAGDVVHYAPANGSEGFDYTVLRLETSADGNVRHVFDFEGSRGSVSHHPNARVLITRNPPE